MSVPLNVLILEDDADDAEVLVLELRLADFAPVWHRVDDEAGFLAGLRRGPDIVLADYSLPAFNALDALAIIREVAPGIPVIVVSGVMTEETCVQCLRLGAVDYLLKDRLTRLGPAVQHALDQRRLVAERRAAERAVRDSSAMLQAMVDAAPSMFYMTDPAGRLMMINDEFARTFGTEPAAVTGLIPGDPAIAGVPAAFAERDARCLRRGTVIEAEEVIATPAGPRTYLSVRYPVRRDDGEVRAVGALYTDITVQKDVQAELRRTQEKLRRQAADLARSNTELQEVDRLKSQFLATVSHELRTPLTSIRGYTELLADGRVGRFSEAERRVIGIIDHESARLLGLIDDLLSFSGPGRGPASPSREPVDPAALVGRCLATVRPAVAKAGLTLTPVLQPSLPPVMADVAQLERVLLNLLGNAVKFTPLGGAVTVRAEHTDAGLTIAVTDTGIGIPAAEQDRLFTRFYRGSSAEQAQIPGTGLGLAICRSIVEAHDGTISAVSAPGAGTTVTVTLPTADTTGDTGTAGTFGGVTAGGEGL